MKKLILFDMDDVLYHYDYMARRANLSQAMKIPIDHISYHWFDAGKENRAEAGFHSNGDEYLEDFCKSVNAQISRKDWVECRARAMRPIMANLQIAKRLKDNGHKVATLTNNGALVFEEMPKLAPQLYEIFGANSYCSWNFGARKPDATVFERAMAHFGASANDTYFIDDVFENANSAQSIGINSIHFTKSTILEKNLAGLL